MSRFEWFLLVYFIVTIGPITIALIPDKLFERIVRKYR